MEGGTLEVLFYETHDVYVHGLPQALGRLGHHVTMWQGGPAVDRLQKYLASQRPGLILSMGWTQMHRDWISLEAIRQYCKSSPALHVYWATEDPLHTSVWTLQYLERVQPDAVLTISPLTLPLLRRLGYPAEELPFAADPGIHRPTPGGPPLDVVLVGTAYGEASGRLRAVGLGWLLRPLAASGRHVEVYGNFWQEAGRYLGFDLPRAWLHPSAAYADVPRLYTAASIVLCPQNEPNQLTGRTFEGLGTGGGVLLTLRTPGVLRHFQDGRHLLCTSSAQETADLLGRYLDDATARRRISDAARDEILRRHTYDHRAQALLDHVARWQEAKRRVGRPLPQGTDRIDMVRPVEVEAGGDAKDRLRLRFELPPRPAGFRLAAARLRCFAQEVRQPGDAFCFSRPGGLLLDVRHVTGLQSNPYPYDASWQEWNVIEALRGLAGSFLDLELRAEQGLSVQWEQPGQRSLQWFVQYNQSAFMPRLELAWTGSPD